jgi:class 3 adenylate cyclase
MTTSDVTILVVDDHSTNRLRLSMAVKHLGYGVVTAANGREALERLRTERCDLVLLDMLMPEMDGYEVLRCMQQSPVLRRIPVIVISAVDEMDSVVTCIELGAEDYLPKAFDPVLLRARVNASLEKKRLRDAVDRQMAFIREAFGKYVPDSVAEAVVNSGGDLEPIRTEATILHTDIGGFSTIVASQAPQQSFRMLNEYYAVVIDQVRQAGGVVNQFQGDSMQVIFNLPMPQERHADLAVRTALRIQEAARDREFAGVRLRTRIGICTGDVIAGNVGSRDRLNYTVVGDAVNMAARLERLNKELDTLVLVSGATVERLTESFALSPSREVRVRGWETPVAVHALDV